ncbi:hypothetical protein PMIN01_08198 [Paraphaeosphaeria minitans]|uniref:F-box domain-containing protein n=1 Tax=Paraphaeosphaeria minitans TaxID=565426 RepID=A0A9P6KPB8_9PLEO|nr:hypothetical protein PMIN01_08198 [Paraphaeosphaeria minitans]
MLSSQHSDLMRLMLPTFSGTKDDFGKEIQDLCPLSFDRINEGRPFSSDFLLSRLPIEITWHIVKQVAKEDLGNLALVNRDCRQLARSRQFATIELDYSDRAISILDTLIKEYEERFENKDKTTAPSIGACIRKITVATKPEWITQHHKVESSEEFLALDAGVRHERLDQACEAFFGTYRPKLNLIISNAQVLPRLESIVWADTAPVDGTFFNAVISSNIRHLVLARVPLGKWDSLDLLSRSCEWRLESLYLSMVSVTKQDPPIGLATCSLLCLASPTLKSLTWASFDLHSKSVVQLPESVNEYPSFRKLQDLRVESLTRYEPGWLNVLIQPGGFSPIRSLEIDICSNERVVDFFCKCGYLPKLETFVWSSPDSKMSNPPLAFLQANSHLRKLKIDGAAPGLLEDKVLPLLCRQFASLTSLSIRWPENLDHVPQSALEQISSLQGLQQLCLSTGCRFGWKHSWVIDHGAIRNCVQHLPDLRKLAFSRDTYAEQVPHAQAGMDPAHYYEDKTLRNFSNLIARPYFQEGDISKKLELAWEMQHRNDMVALAAEYAETLAKLEWIFLGQRPMRIDRTATGKAKPVPLSTDRDDCWTYLKQLFGRGNDYTFE